MAGEPPRTLWKVRVFAPPVIVVARPPSCGAELLRVFVPPAAADDARVELRRPGDRLGRFRRLAGEFLVARLAVLVEHPLAYVAVNIVQAPGAGLLLTHLVRRLAGVVEVPGIVAELLGIVAEE